MTGVRTCECRRFGDGTICGAQASYRVARGRKYDAQDSCARHLARTVTALIGAEKRPVTVTAIRYGEVKP